MLKKSRISGAAMVLLAGLLSSASDCAPGIGVGEAADCCACLGEHDASGNDAAPSTNCLPDDISQGFDTRIEIQQCAADAADAIGGEGRVVADAACREDGHPCANICARARDEGVTFKDPGDVDASSGGGEGSDAEG